MRYLTALFITLFTINSSVMSLDVLDSFVRDTNKIIRNTKKLKRNARNFLNNNDDDWDSYNGRSRLRNGSRNYDQNGFKYSSNTAPIDKIFPKYRIKKIKISPNGDRVVSLIEDKTTRIIRIFSSTNKNSWNQTIKESMPINNFELFGSNIIYEYKDKSGEVCVVAVNSKLEKRKLKINNGVKSVRFISGNNAVIVECYYGKGRYNVYRVDARSCERIAEPTQPVMSFFNQDLSSIKVIIKVDDEQKVNVYVPNNKQNKQNKKKRNRDFFGSDYDYEEENVVSFDSDEVEEDTRNLTLIKCIDNPDQERPISVDSDGNIWWVRIDHESDKDVFVLEKINPNKSQYATTAFSLHGVSALDQMRVNLNSKGYPMFVTFNGAKYQHFFVNAPQNNGIRGDINGISDHLDNWYLVNVSSNGRFWLICAVQDNTLEKFYIYDTQSRSLQRFEDVTSLSNNINTNYIRQTAAHFLPVPGTKDKLQIFVTRGTFSGGNGLSSSDAPCVILLNSEEQYRKGYMPIVQLLANRGCNVVCLNYSKEIGRESLYEDSDGADKFKQYITTAVNWCTRNDLARHGNIVLLAKNHSCVPAFDIFAGNEKIFDCFIALSPDENDLNRIANHNLSDQISKPVVFISDAHFNNEELKYARQIGADSSIINLKNNGITQMLNAMIVPFILKKRFDNIVRTEKLSRQEIEKYVDIVKDDLNIFDDINGNGEFDDDDSYDDNHSNRRNNSVKGGGNFKYL